MGERIRYGDITDKRVLVGKRISMYSNSRESANKMWTATVKSVGKADPSLLNLVDNTTYNIDGSVRANGAKKRYGYWEASFCYFEYVDAEVPQPDVTIPETYGELNDSHIGMRFKVYGSPVMEGTYEGPGPSRSSRPTGFWADSTSSYNYEPTVWSKKNDFSYVAKAEDKIEYISGAPEKPEVPSLTQKEIEDKLIAYANQRMAELVGQGEGDSWFALFSGGASNAARFHIGEAFLTIYKELNGEA